MKFKPGSFEEVTWDQVRDRVKALVPDVFEAIEKISPGKKHKLYLAKYAYGVEMIAKDGMFSVQSGEEIVSLASDKISQEVKDNLVYNRYGVPLSMVLKGQVQRVALEPAFNLFETGSLFSIQAALDYPESYQTSQYFQMYSGAKTVYLLPSIANRQRFIKLKQKYSFDADIPSRQVDEWLVFRALANSDSFQNDWHCECLFFGKEFVENIMGTPELYMALASRVLKSTLHSRLNTFEGIWEDVASKIRNKKVDRYILNMSRHIIRASLGSVASYRIADDKEESGPLYQIAKALASDYGLEKYAPIMMTPFAYNVNNQVPAYVSIQLPTVKYQRKYISKTKYLLADFREIKYVIDKFVQNASPKIGRDIPLYNFHRYHYTFGSADSDNLGVVGDAEDLFLGDPALDYWAGLNEGNIDVRNTFMRACVRIG